MEKTLNETQTPPPPPATPAPTPDGDPFFYGWRYVERTLPDGTVVTDQVPLTEEDVLHPQEEDFIVQNEAHIRDVFYLKMVLPEHLADRPGWLVLGDHRVTWGVPWLGAHGPDIAVFEGVAAWDEQRGTFPVGEMRARPRLVIEVTSPSTRSGDLGAKIDHYFQAGVPFYVIADALPNRQPRQVRLMGYRAAPGGYVPVPLDARGWLWMEPVDLWLAFENGRLVCYDADGRRLNDFAGEARERRAAQALAAAEKARADAEAAARAEATGQAEAEKARADAEAAARAEATGQAEAEKARADAEKARAEAEKMRAEAAEAQLREMEAELRRLRGENP